MTMTGVNSAWHTPLLLGIEKKTALWGRVVSSSATECGQAMIQDERMVVALSNPKKYILLLKTKCKSCSTSKS